MTVEQLPQNPKNRTDRPQIYVVAIIGEFPDQSILIKPSDKNNGWFFPGIDINNETNLKEIASHLIISEIDGITVEKVTKIANFNHHGQVTLFICHCKGWPDRKSGLQSSTFAQNQSFYHFSPLGVKISEKYNSYVRRHSLEKELPLFTHINPP